jgi:uncharacterized protein YraI
VASVRHRLFALALLALSPLVAAEASATCKGARQVLVKEKTPIRKGPGLNYPVKSFLEKGKCLRLTEVSADRAWALVESGDVFGWVPAERLDAAGQKVVAKMTPGATPVGSGQKRGYVFAATATPLYERPDASSGERKTLPPEAKLLVLAVTENESWVQVRDDRNDVGWISMSSVRDPSGALALVPRTDDDEVTSSVELTDRIEQPVGVEEEVRRPAGPAAIGLVIDARVLVGANLPAQGLDSNGLAAYRRYDVSAFAGTARVEAKAAPLGPLSARLAFGFTMLAGIAPEAQPDNTIGGQQLEGRLVFGVPLGVITPELGYYFGSTTIDPAIAGAPAAQFESTVTHGASIGASADFALSAPLYLEVELAALVGTTTEDPVDIGEPGLTFGALAGLGIGFAVGDAVDLLLRWNLRYQSTPFTGPSIIDPSITEATLTALDNSILAGVAFAL